MIKGGEGITFLDRIESLLLVDLVEEERGFVHRMLEGGLIEASFPV
jgi:hypothetical protein